MINTIIFDYGNVIFDIKHQLTIDAFIELGLQNDKGFFGHLQQNPLFDEFEKGNISPDEFRESIRNFAQIPLSDDAIDKAWNALLIGIRPGYLEFLSALKTQVPIYLLSNNNAIHYAWILNYLQSKHNVNGMSGFFEKDYYSHLLHMRKPDAEIFEFVLNSHQLKAAETLFIDDSPQHIATAAKLGLQTHLMQQTDSLQAVVKHYLK